METGKPGEIRSTGEEGKKFVFTDGKWRRIEKVEGGWVMVVADRPVDR